MRGLFLVTVAVAAVFLLEKPHVSRIANRKDKAEFYILLGCAFVAGMLQSFEFELPNPTMILTTIFKPIHEQIQLLLK